MLALPVTCSTIFDAERAESLEVGKSLRLECKVADSTVAACWYKDDTKLCPPKGWGIKSNDLTTGHITPSAELLQPELYSCQTFDDSIHFSETIKGDILIQIVCFRANAQAVWTLTLMVAVHIWYVCKQWFVRGSVYSMLKYNTIKLC